MNRLCAIASQAPRVRCEEAAAKGEKAPEQTVDERPPDEPLPGAPEEAEDDEGDLAALMAASSTILRRKQALSRKRTRQQRDAQATLPLLEPDLVDADPLVGGTQSAGTSTTGDVVIPAAGRRSSREKKARGDAWKLP